MTNQVNGAVQVLPEKLHKALLEYERQKQDLDDIVKIKTDYVINELYPKLTKFKKWWYGQPEHLNGNGQKFYTACKAYGGSGYSEYNSLTQFSNLRELKFISEEDYNLCYKFYGYYGESSTYNDLKAMLDCGQPIYVNPSQAKFINEYYRESV